MLVVVDQDGTPLTRIPVDVVSVGTADHYRERGITDGLGRISFSSVPEMVNVTAVADNGKVAGAYSQNIGVSPIGSSEVRMTVQTFEVQQATPAPEPAEPAPTPGGR